MLKEIEGFPGYFVSDDGRVFSENHRHPQPKGYRRELVQMVAPNGYRKVSLYDENGVASQIHVHALVARTFIGERPCGYDVCHNDGDKSNNNVSNLRYDTKSNNNRDKIKHGTHQGGERCGQAKLTYELVKLARQERKISGTPYRKMARKYGVSPTSICCACNKKTWKCVS